MNEKQLRELQAALTPRLNKYIPVEPTAKQTAALLMNNVKELLYGGAAGGGKSVFLLAAALQYVDEPNYSAILFRKTFSDLMLPGALIPMSQEWLAPYLSDGEVRWQDKEKRYTFPSGSTLSFGYLDGKGDELRYQGAEFQFVGMDECTHIDPAAYRYLFSRLRRTKKSSIPIRFRATCNPGGTYGDYYYKRFWVDNLKEDGTPLRFFLQSGLADNPHLDAETYHEALAELDEITRAQLEDGNWLIKASGDLFNADWIRDMKWVDIPKYTRWVRFWDLAAIDPKYRRDKNRSGGRNPDYSVGFKMGLADGKYIIDDIIKVQKAAGDLETLIHNTAISDGYGCAIRMEEEGGSSGMANTDRYSRIVLPGFDFEGVKPVVSKAERARPLAAAMQCGNVYITDRCRHVTDYYSQLTAFPNGSNDDMVDAGSGAFIYFRPALGRMSPPPDFSETRHIILPAEQAARKQIRTINGSYWLNPMSNRR